MFLSLKTLYRKRTVIWPFYFYTIIRTLSYFSEEKGFDTITRLNSIIDDLYERVFIFNPYILNLDKEDVNLYLKLSEKFREDEELLDLLKEHGKYFGDKVSRDPSLSELYERYLIINNKIINNK
ncbi:hypothetical protein EA71_02597 [Enterococcus durans]|uniref:Uncharacterized protein n=2 Tax=Enterococcus durans TaxID=53345 RepID=A0A367CB79_9ENTE|nr:hypothetical protein EA71_02597 [Enterococcus durans]